MKEIVPGPSAGSSKADSQRQPDTNGGQGVLSETDVQPPALRLLAVWGWG